MIVRMLAKKLRILYIPGKQKLSAVFYDVARAMCRQGLHRIAKAIAFSRAVCAPFVLTPQWMFQGGVVCTA
jgi:hypothetical protein